MTKTVQKFFQKQQSNFNIGFQGMQVQSQLQTLLDLLKKRPFLAHYSL